MKIDIPGPIAKAIRLPAPRIKQELLVELAVSLYTQQLLSFGKARELAKMEKREFGELLGKRKIARHYDEEDLQDDLNYASSQ